MSSSLLASLLACAPPSGADASPVLVAPVQAASPEKPMITSVQTGLSDQHRAQTPLFDRIELSRGPSRATRLYADGTEYILNQDAASGVASWSRFVTVTPAGVDRVRQVLRESVATWQGVPPSAGPSGGGGTIVWVVQIDGKERVLETASGAYSALPPWVRQIDEAVSQNVRPAG